MHLLHVGSSWQAGKLIPLFHCIMLMDEPWQEQSIETILVFQEGEKSYILFLSDAFTYTILPT